MKNGATDGIVAPQPVPASSGNGLLSEPNSQSSDAGSSLFPMSERQADLPPALHSDSNNARREGPVEVPPALDWDEAGPSEVPESQWGLLRRARGPVEIEEEAEDDNSALSESPPLTLVCYCRGCRACSTLRRRWKVLRSELGLLGSSATTRCPLSAAR
jgi:hypothetical protein